MAQQIQQASAEAQQASLQLLKQGEETNRELMRQNQAIMQRLTAMAATDNVPPPSRDWNPLQVKLVKNDNDRSPAEGFNVTLSGHAHSTSEKVSLSEQTTAAGIVDFGVVRPGTYAFTILTPWGDSHRFSSVVKPGTKHIAEVICPAQEATGANIDLRFNWPATIPQDPNLALVCQVQRLDQTVVEGRTWSATRPVYLIIRQNGEMATCNTLFDFDGNIQPLWRDGVVVQYVPICGASTPIDSLKIAGTRFMLSELNVVHLPDGRWPKDESVYRLAPNKTLSRFQVMMPLYQERQRQSRNVETPESLNFEVKANEANEWRINLPSSLAQDVLASLKCQTHASLSSDQVTQACAYFFLEDTDGNLELSEAECVASENSHRIKFGEFPVTFDKFITISVEM